MITRKIQTSTPQATEALATSIGARFRGGEIIELVSDLGGGKTTFTRGLASGIGSKDVVASPTFTISKIYTSEKLTLHHFDFYRLNNSGLIAHELHDVMQDANAVVVVEWADIVKEVLPVTRLTVTIAKIVNDEGRLFTFSCPDELSYLLEDA